MLRNSASFLNKRCLPTMNPVANLDAALVGAGIPEISSLTAHALVSTRDRVA
jgi:hypothetical protein